MNKEAIILLTLWISLFFLLFHSFHKNLIEHLNAEIVLNTITSLTVALEWLKSTFLYIRVMKNPSYYGKELGERGASSNDLVQKSIGLVSPMLDRPMLSIGWCGNN